MEFYSLFLFGEARYAERKRRGALCKGDAEWWVCFLFFYLYRHV
tara:strand:- start:39 stop:170 length:132 start_codon:yes stop_codon:yes gene_type:complete